MLVWSQAVKDVAPLKTSTKACWKMVFYYIGYYRRKITNAHDCKTSIDTFAGRIEQEIKKQFCEDLNLMDLPRARHSDILLEYIGFTKDTEQVQLLLPL